MFVKSGSFETWTRCVCIRPACPDFLVAWAIAAALAPRLSQNEATPPESLSLAKSKRARGVGAVVPHLIGATGSSSRSLNRPTLAGTRVSPMSHALAIASRDSIDVGSGYSGVRPAPLDERNQC